MDDLIRALVVLLHDLLNELRDADIHGTAVHAGVVLAVQAAGGLVQRLLLGVAQGHLQEVLLRTLGSWEGISFLSKRILILPAILLYLLLEQIADFLVLTHLEIVIHLVALHRQIPVHLLTIKVRPSTRRTSSRRLRSDGSRRTYLCRRS